jgi:hypothetical protein
MPRLSVWFIRCALVYLLLGFTLGGLLLANKGIPLVPWIWGLLPAHIEFVLVGWTLQLVLGVAYWILPRFSRGSRRGNQPLAWAAFWLLNSGIAGSVLALLFPSYSWPVFAARLAETAAILAFAVHAWPRVKPTGA